MEPGEEVEATRPLDLETVRSRFPALDRGTVFLDNGGGSQVVEPVLDRIREYLVMSNVQLGASYAASRLASDRVAAAHRAVAVLVNATAPEEIVMGPSTTVLFRTLAESLGRTIQPGDEVVVSNGDHEANIAPWIALERFGASVRHWRVDPRTGELDPEDLWPLLGPRTRLVAMTHTSNVLGSINPIRDVADRVHACGAWLCVDGVAFAPHRAVDVRALGVDFYAFSFYKTFGPHHAVMYGRSELLRALPGLGFFFVDEADVPYKFQPGNVNYELSYGVMGVLDYLQEAGGLECGDRDDGGYDRAALERAFDRFARHEEALAGRLLDFLTSKRGVRVIGSPSPHRSRRVAIVSFTVDGRRSEEIVHAVDAHDIGIRHGHFYSARLVEALGLDAEDGVVRVSMVHYNTADEIDRLIEILDPLL